MAIDDPLSAPRFEVRLSIDGQPLSLKPFMHEMIGGAVAGLVQGLKGVNHPQEIHIEVKALDPARRIPEDSP